jgi:hypothetical protein
MLFQASRAVPASSEMYRLIRVSEYAPPSPSLLIPACIETLGANSGANQLPKGSGRRAAFSRRLDLRRLEHLPQPTPQYQRQVVPDRVRPEQVQILHRLQ